MHEDSVPVQQNLGYCPVTCKISYAPFVMLTLGLRLVLIHPREKKFEQRNDSNL